MRKRRVYISNKEKKLRVKIGIVLTIIGVLTLLILADGTVRAIIRGYPLRIASGVMLEHMDAAMETVLAKENFSPESIDRVRYDESGAVLSIESDTATLNRLKTAFTKTLGERLKEYGDTITVRVPIGTLIGNEYTVGRGPDIRFDLRYSYAISTDLDSTFYEAGINNTLHSIEMNVTNHLYILIPWGNSSQEISTKYILAETVIVGKVPDAYTGVYDGSGEIVDDIFDHQAVGE